MTEGIQRARGGQPGNKNARKHALSTLRRALIDLGSRAIDGRSTVGVAMRKWKQDLIADLGGPDGISTAQEALIDIAARSKIMLDSIDNWILGQPTLINTRKKSMLAVVQQRQAIADGLCRVIEKLGLERKAKSIDLATRLKELGTNHSPTAESAALSR